MVYAVLYVAANTLDMIFGAALVGSRAFLVLIHFCFSFVFDNYIIIILMRFYSIAYKTDAYDISVGKEPLCLCLL